MWVALQHRGYTLSWFSTPGFTSTESAAVRMLTLRESVLLLIWESIIYCDTHRRLNRLKGDHEAQIRHHHYILYSVDLDTHCRSCLRFYVHPVWDVEKLLLYRSIMVPTSEFFTFTSAFPFHGRGFGTLFFYPHTLCWQHCPTHTSHFH